MMEWKKHGRIEIAAEPTLPGVWRARGGGFYVRGRVIDPQTSRLKEVSRLLPEVTEPAEALLWLRTELGQIRAGKDRQRAVSRTRFADFAVSRLEEKVASGRIWSPKGREKVVDILEHHLLPHFGEMWVDAITREDIEDWKRQFQTKVSSGQYAPSTANTILRQLKAILRRVLPEIAEVESFDESGHVTYTEEEPNALLPDQVPSFLAAFRAHYPQHYAMVVLGFATGLRPSSMRGIRRLGATPDLLWDQKVLYVRRSVTRGEVAERTKTGLRQRLHVPEDLLAIFRWHVMRFNGPQQDSELLFPAETGGYRADSVLDKPFKRISLGLGISLLTPRAMRRTYQDLARAADIDDKVTRSISGHLTERMQAHYSTIGAEEQRQAMGQIISLARAREAIGA